MRGASHCGPATGKGLEQRDAGMGLRHSYRKPCVKVVPHLNGLATSIAKQVLFEII